MILPFFNKLEFLGSYKISRDEFNGAIRFVIRDLENFRFSTEITVLPFFRKIEFFSGFTHEEVQGGTPSE